MEKKGSDWKCNGTMKRLWWVMLYMYLIYHLFLSMHILTLIWVGTLGVRLVGKNYPPCPKLLKVILETLYISDLPFVSVYAHFGTDLGGHFRGPFSGLKLPTLSKIPFIASNPLNFLMSVFSCRRNFFRQKYYLCLKQ